MVASARSSRVMSMSVIYSFTRSHLFSIDAEWITARKDYLDAKKRSKAKHKENSNADVPATESDTQIPGGLPTLSSSGNNSYKEEMDEMRCILYAHGGMCLR
jgi:hypothetical protein